MPDSPSNPDLLDELASSAMPPLPKSPRPICIVGAGGIIQSAHLPAYAKAGFPVVAITDQQLGKAAEVAAKFSIPHAFDSLAEMVRFAPPDAIFDIAVPASQLLPILTQLPNGAPVLMQKPMGETIAEARAIRDLCRAKGLTAAVNFQLRFAPNNLGAVALAQQGVLGRLHDMEVQVRTYTPWHLWTFLSTAPRLEILYHSIHYLDLVRSWFGEPRSVYAKTVKNPQCEHLAPTKTTMILDYGDDKRVFLATNHGHDFPAESHHSFAQWEGTNGAIRIDMGVNLDYPTGTPDRLRYALRGPGSAWREVPVRGSWFPDAFLGSMGSLQAYVEGSAKELPTHFESAYRTMALVEAAYVSSDRGGVPVELEKKTAG
jgi:predicted dehydrogenase